MHIGATHHLTSAAAGVYERTYPMPPSRTQISGRAVLTRAVVHVHDLLEDPEYPRDLALAGGWRSALSVPMLRDGNPIGAINVIRAEPSPFSDKQIALLQIFADQAVIAIENVRLFTELEEKNRALTEAHAQVTEALEQQTATSEILRVISSSPTDVQPVFDAIAESSRRLCDAFTGSVFRFDGSLHPLRRSQRSRAGSDRDHARALPGSPEPRQRDSAGDSSPGHRPYSGRARGCRVPDSPVGERRGDSKRPRRADAPRGSAHRHDHRQSSRGRRRFRTSRSRFSRRSPIRRSSPSRTCGCSRSWRRATPS